MRASEKQPTVSEYHKRKQERKDYYDKYVKYWVEEDCTACNGSGYYDNEESPECGGCDGTGKSWDKPDYEEALTDVESLIGKTLVVSLSDLVDLRVYVNKRREVIYQYENLADPDNKLRIRTRLRFGYSEDGRYQDWYFEDTLGERYYLKDFEIQK